MEQHRIEQPAIMQLVSAEALIGHWSLSKAAVYLGVDESTLRKWVKSSPIWQKAVFKIGTIMYTTPHLLMDVQRELAQKTFPEAWETR